MLSIGLSSETHIVGMESRGGRAHRSRRGRGAAARPPAREYHRRVRMPRARACRSPAPALAGPGRRSPLARLPRALVLNKNLRSRLSTRRARTRVFINGIPHALFAAGYNFLHDFRHLRRPEYWKGEFWAPELSDEVRVSRTTAAYS